MKTNLNRETEQPHQAGSRDLGGHPLKSPTLCVRDLYCRGSCSGSSVEEQTTLTEVVCPYRGIYVRHLAQDQSVAEANQALLFNADESYRISNSIPIDDASPSLAIDPVLLLKIVPAEFFIGHSMPVFGRKRVRIDARTQAPVAMLRHSLRQGLAESLEKEGLALTS
jgi:AraC family transcriptional regulator